ncbi:toll/interleukin-1 receptor domain-containing protein [Catenovulum agarivorans]|uniref:toll/interleukin-1 receptor domain-containing protein n=1 Tax=Catenovulum agarivorans TaxID=1172192 RepID=UPI0002E94791|nr:toll/interleukin-1 receptor domain-containing protein [Catenovulum agarivorans]
MFDAFISHASRDYDLVAELVEFLEEQQLVCWLAPRNIPASAHYGAEIVKGIEQSQVLVLVLTEHSNHSSAVAKEVERAFSKGKKIIPLRLQDIAPSADLEFYISSCQWIDSLEYASQQKSRYQLAEQIKSLPNAATSKQANSALPSRKSKKSPSHWSTAIIAAAGSVFVLVMLLLFAGWKVEPVDEHLAEVKTAQNTSVEPQAAVDDPHLWLSQGQKKLRQLIMDADLEGLNKFLANKDNLALLTEREGELGLPLLLDMIKLKTTNLDKVIQALVDKGHFDPNQLFTSYSNMPMEEVYYFWPVQQTYLLNLASVYERLGTFSVWQQHVEQQFGYKLPEQWQAQYQKSQYPSDIEGLYNSSSGKVTYTAQLFSHLVDNQSVFVVLNKQPNIAASTMLLSNGVEIPLSSDNWQWITQVQMPDKNWYLIEQQEKAVK